MFKTLTVEALEAIIDETSDTLENFAPAARNGGTYGAVARTMTLLLQELEDRRILACHGGR